MKFFLSSLLLLLSSFSALAGQITVKVNGMVCSMCAQGIQKKFSAEPAVKDLKVDMDKKLVTINEKDGSTITDETITKLISEAGYNVATIERK